MEQLVMLITLSFSMFVGSYVSGTIPMIFGLSEDKVRQLTILGSGILVGTALSVIIPEGVHSIYSSVKAIPSEAPPHLPDGSGVAGHKPLHEHSPHSAIGITLVLGFVFMFCVEQFVNKHTSVAYAPVSTSSIEDGAVPAATVSSRRKSSKLTATIGLIVHSAADGIALGAAASTSHTDVEIIVFLAIMLHKAPAAFGLVTFLLHEGLDKSRIKKHLLAFALSAPIGTFLTYFCLGSAFQDTLSDYNATGIAMLFSAGTFLFVATVHVLPEITQHRDLRVIELLLLIGGSFLPSALTINHHH